MLNFRLFKLGEVTNSCLFQINLRLFLCFHYCFLDLLLLILLHIRLLSKLLIEITFQLLFVGHQLIFNLLELFLLFQFLFFELLLFLFKFSSDLLALSFLLSLAHVELLLCLLALLFCNPIKFFLALGLLCGLNDHECLLPVHLVMVFMDFVFRVFFAD